MTNPIRLEIDEEVLKILLARHLIRIDDFRCMDPHSKQCVQRLWMVLAGAGLHSPESIHARCTRHNDPLSP